MIKRGMLLMPLAESLLQVPQFTEGSMSEIPLTQGKVALVDEQDYERVVAMKWHAALGRGGWYAVHGIRHQGRTALLRMHRFVLNCQSGQEVDHINHDGLDNRRCNLRLCTRSQNVANSRKTKNNTSSRFKGVYWDTYYKRWRAQIGHNGQKHYLGSFDSEENAARTYNTKALELFGEFALLNKI